MSKTSKTDTPSSSTTTLSINGNNKATVYSGDGGTSMNYQMDPYELQSYNYAQKSFAENLPNINVFSPETIADLNKQVEAFKNKGVKNINEIYTPLLKDLQNNIASRFGNLNNSVFMDKLSDIESKRAESISELSQDIAAKEQDLKNNELINRYNYLSFLNGYQNQALSNMYNALGMGNSANNSSMSYINNIPTSTSSNNNTALINALMQAVLSRYSGG